LHTSPIKIIVILTAGLAALQSPLYMLWIKNKVWHFWCNSILS